MARHLNASSPHPAVGFTGGLGEDMFPSLLPSDGSLALELTESVSKASRGRVWMEEGAKTKLEWQRPVNEISENTMQVVKLRHYFQSKEKTVFLF